MNVTILDGTTQNVGDTAFQDCVNLRTIVLPNNIKQIDYMAFRGCVNLESINIPADATYIGSNAFNGCASLSEIIIPESIVYIQSAAFIDCTSLTRIFFGRNHSSGLPSIIAEGNELLSIATHCWYSEEVPGDTDYNYWHYDADGVTPIVW